MTTARLPVGPTLAAAGVVACTVAVVAAAFVAPSLAADGNPSPVVVCQREVARQVPGAQPAWHAVAQPAGPRWTVRGGAQYQPAPRPGQGQPVWRHVAWTCTATLDGHDWHDVTVTVSPGA